MKRIAPNGSSLIRPHGCTEEFPTAAASARKRQRCTSDGDRLDGTRRLAVSPSASVAGLGPSVALAPPRSPSPSRARQPLTTVAVQHRFSGHWVNAQLYEVSEGHVEVWLLGQRAGRFTTILHAWPPSSPMKLDVTDLDVDRAYREAYRGLGAGLMARAIQDAQCQAQGRIVIGTAMIEAVGFYQKMGFTIDPGSEKPDRCAMSLSEDRVAAWQRHVESGLAPVEYDHASQR